MDALFSSPRSCDARCCFLCERKRVKEETHATEQSRSPDTQNQKKKNNQNPDKESAVPVTTGLDTKQWEGIKVKQMFCNRLTGMILTDCEIKCMYDKGKVFGSVFLDVCVCLHSLFVCFSFD